MVLLPLPFVVIGHLSSKRNSASPPISPEANKPSKPKQKKQTPAVACDLSRSLAESLIVCRRVSAVSGGLVGGSIARFLTAESTERIPVDVRVVGSHATEVVLSHAAALRSLLVAVVVVVAATAESALLLLLLSHAATSTDRLHPQALRRRGFEWLHDLLASVWLHHPKLLRHGIDGTVALLLRGERVVDAGDCWVVGVVGVVRDLVRRDGAVRVRISAIGHRVRVVKVWTRLRVVYNGSWADACRRLVDRIGREGGRVDCGHPEADFVELVQVIHQILEVNIVIGVVVKYQLLPVPGMCVSMDR